MYIHAGALSRLENKVSAFWPYRLVLAAVVAASMLGSWTGYHACCKKLGNIRWLFLVVPTVIGLHCCTWIPFDCLGFVLGADVAGGFPSIFTL